MKYINYDKNRYLKNDMPIFQKMFRRYWDTNNKILRLVYKILFRYYRNKNLIDMSIDTKIGEGLYIGHPYCITINPKAVIGKNCNIHKGVTIGQENRGVRKGTPVIGDEVWIGINSTIVGNVKIGNDVLFLQIVLLIVIFQIILLYLEIHVLLNIEKMQQKII